MDRLFSYKMTHDTGFAPNPFHGFLTLATCKPLIRKHKKVGDWIAGFTSVGLNGDPVGQEKLVYLMKITDKVTIGNYWKDKTYQYKKFTEDNNSALFFGDNIYEPISPGEFKQHENSSHYSHDMQRDTSGVYVLISKHFYYFGKNALSIPKQIRPIVPKAQAGHGVRTKDQIIVSKFLEFVSKKDIGINGNPTDWKRKYKLNKNESCSK